METIKTKPIIIIIRSVLPYLIPKDEISLLQTKSRATMRFYQQHNHTNIIKMILRLFYFQSNNKSWDYETVYPILNNLWNSNQILKSLELDKPFLIPMQCYKVGQDSHLTSSSIYAVLNFKYFNDLLWTQINRNYSYQLDSLDSLDLLNVNLLKHVLLKSSSLKNTLTINDIRFSNNLLEDAKKGLLQNLTANKKTKFIDWDIVFGLQTDSEFYNTFFSINYLILSSFLGQKIEDLAILIHRNVDLDTDDIDLLNELDGVKCAKDIRMIAQARKIDILQKSSTFLEDLIEFDTNKSQGANNLKLLAYVSLKNIGYHFLNLRSFYHQGRFVIFKVFSESFNLDVQVYGHMFKY